MPNLADIYREAIGQVKEPAPQEESPDLTLIQIEWKQHPGTKKLLAWLESEIVDLNSRARALSEIAFTDKETREIAKLVNQQATLTRVCQQILM